MFFFWHVISDTLEHLEDSEINMYEYNLISSEQRKIFHKILC